MKLLSVFVVMLLSCFSAGARDNDIFLPVADTGIINSLFDSEEVLDLSLTGGIRELLSDRGEEVRPHAFTISYTEKEGREITLPVTVRTRGHFRKMRENCIYPPLMLQFAKTEPAVANSLFSKNKKVKLVMPCMSGDYVVREWMVYRLYQLITPKSLKARLVTVQLNDAKKKSNKAGIYGILLEEEQQMAERNQAKVVETKLLKPEDTKRKDFLTMAVFQYLIGNTDWSVQFLQNIKLIAPDPNSAPSAVAYDFDHAGIVNAPYAQPAEALRLSSVKERRYRGFCVEDVREFTEVVALFNSLKGEIYSLYNNATLLDEKYKKTTLKYFDEFYETINNNEAMRKQFLYPRDKNGTGNVIIKGLQKD